MNSTPIERERASPPRAPGAAALSVDALAAAVAHALPDGRLRLMVEAQLPSTNAALLEQARQQQPDRAVLLAADHQTAGRGRQGRSWQARAGDALLFSLAVPLRQRPPALPAMTLACGVALARTLRARGLDVWLKWPNDLLLDGRKLGGMLCELATDSAGRATLVVGVGINVRLSDEDRAAIGQPAAALTDVTGVDAGREAWIAMLAAALLDVIGAYAERGFEPWRDAYSALLAGRGAEADIVDAGHRVAQGRIVDVDVDGRLLLHTDAGMIAVSVGDVSLRVAARGAT